MGWPRTYVMDEPDDPTIGSGSITVIAMTDEEREALRNKRPEEKPPFGFARALAEPEHAPRGLRAPAVPHVHLSSCTPERCALLCPMRWDHG